LEEAGLSGPRDKYGIAVLAIRRGRECVMIPSREEEIKPGDILILAGNADQLGRLQEMPKEKRLGSGDSSMSGNQLPG
jgi:uncharacterized protein with PhoU and TrkA domain